MQRENWIVNLLTFLNFAPKIEPNIREGSMSDADVLVVVVIVFVVIEYHPLVNHTLRPVHTERVRHNVMSA